jgi:hypothetical protein
MVMRPRALISIQAVSGFAARAGDLQPKIALGVHAGIVGQVTEAYCGKRPTGFPAAEGPA